MAKFILTGGGTGGHVFPALSIAEELLQRGHSILYVGTSHGLESKLVPEKGIPFFTVRTGAVKNQGTLKIVKTAFALFRGVLWSLQFLLKEKPKAVIGVGGYVSFPICFAGFLLGIPVFLQEQNSSVGISNRILGKFAKKIFLGFSEAESYFPKAKCIYTGNPLRKEFSQNFPTLKTESGFLLVMGGSQGAKAINDALLPLLPLLKEQFPHLEILHQTGPKDFESVQSRSPKNSWYKAQPFIQDVISAYSKAALVVSRSGALTVSELMQTKRPAIFVPYPRKGQNDQTTNAYLMEKRGVAKVVEQGEAFEARFKQTLLETLSPSVLKEMALKYKELPTRDGRKAIADYIENV
jgi:UDP-N-acetylglucosamine--N-acetylmuramyl-(pentapeptide) pyrophosphoryl-undecaprenol N-acetylglucosamine transferase